MDFQRWLREAAGELSESESPKRDAEAAIAWVKPAMRWQNRPAKRPRVRTNTCVIIHGRVSELVPQSVWYWVSC